MATLSAAGALATLGLIAAVVTLHSKQQATVLDGGFEPWKATPWDDRAGQGVIGGDWDDQQGNYIGAGQKALRMQSLSFDPYHHMWDSEPMNSEQRAKEKNLFYQDKWAKLYGYGSQQKAPLQSLAFDPTHHEWEREPINYDRAIKQENLYYHDKWAKLYGYGSQQKAPVQSLLEESDPYREDGSPSEAKEETALHYQQELNRFYNEESSTPLAAPARTQALAQPWELDQAPRKLALEEMHKYNNQKWQRYFSGEDGDNLV